MASFFALSIAAFSEGEKCALTPPAKCSIWSPPLLACGSLVRFAGASCLRSRSFPLSPPFGILLSAPRRALIMLEWSSPRFCALVRASMYGSAVCRTISSVEVAPNPCIVPSIMPASPEKASSSASMLAFAIAAAARVNSASEGLAGASRPPCPCLRPCAPIVSLNLSMADITDLWSPRGSRWSVSITLLHISL